MRGLPARSGKSAASQFCFLINHLFWSSIFIDLGHGLTKQDLLEFSHLRQLANVTPLLAARTEDSS